MSRIVHELLGQLYKSNKPWSAEIVPSILMRELVSAVEDGKMTGLLFCWFGRLC